MEYFLDFLSSEKHFYYVFLLLFYCFFSPNTYFFTNNVKSEKVRKKIELHI